MHYLIDLLLALWLGWLTYRTGKAQAATVDLDHLLRERLKARLTEATGTSAGRERLRLRLAERLKARES